MSHDSYSPITTSRTLEWPLGHRIYSTTRPVAGETEPPAVGSLMSAVLGPESPYAAHVVIASSEGPRTHSQRTHSISHMAVPAGTFTRYRSTSYVFPAIYPQPGSAFHEGGSNARPRVVPGREVWEFTRPGTADWTAWLAAPAVWDGLDPATGPFEVRSFIAEAAGQTFLDGDDIVGRVGEYLNLAFVTQDTLNDAVTIAAPGDLAYPIPASIPTRSTYVGWVLGSPAPAVKREIMVSRTISDWYGDIAARRTLFVAAQ